MGAIEGLRCRECGRAYPAEALHVCDFCFGPLEVVYDYDALRRRVSHASHPGGPADDLALWRAAPRRRAGAGRPRRRLHPAASAPTGSRPRSASASSGSRTTPATPPTRSRTGSSRSRSPRRASSASRSPPAPRPATWPTPSPRTRPGREWTRYVFIPSNLERAKIVTTAVFGGRLVAVEGTYDDVNRLCAELASEHPDWAFVNVNVRPYYAEGSKTLAYEIAEQLGWRRPTTSSSRSPRAAS